MSLANGVYRARAVSWALGLTNTNKEQIAIELEILDEEAFGQKITWYGYFTDKAFDVTLKALRTLGWRGTDLSELTGLDSNEVHIVVESEEYQGKYYPRVKWINPLNGGGIPLKNQLDPSAAKAFAAKMKARILSVEQANGRPAQQQRPQSRPPSPPSRQSYVGGPPEPPPHDDSDYVGGPADDDVPF